MLCMDMKKIKKWWRGSFCWGFVSDNFIILSALCYFTVGLLILLVELFACIPLISSDIFKNIRKSGFPSADANFYSFVNK